MIHFLFNIQGSVPFISLERKKKKRENSPCYFMQISTIKIELFPEENISLFYILPSDKFEIFQYISLLNYQLLSLISCFLFSNNNKNILLARLSTQLLFLFIISKKKMTVDPFNGINSSDMLQNLRTVSRVSPRMACHKILLIIKACRRIAYPELYIIYNKTEERTILPHEKPFIIFRELQKQGYSAQLVFRSISRE